MTTHVALLRGINVGGKHKLPMAELRGIFEDAGAEDVRTYIQSGNVVFSASAARAKGLFETIAEAIEDSFGFEVPVIGRSAEQLRAVVERDPYPPAQRDPKLHYVGFLAAKPKAALVRQLDPDRSPPDTFEVVGAEIYLRYPNGSARSKLTNAWFDRVLQTTSTMRNWRTVTTLLEMTEG
jgi:uncharacterized protein (DUF1697 family)